MTQRLCIVIPRVAARCTTCRCRRCWACGTGHWTWSGPARGVAIALTPPGAYALFGVPLREPANATAGFEDLLGREAALLTERLSESPGRSVTSWARGCSTRRRRHGRCSALGTASPRPATRGRLRIGALVDEVGWTRRHLTTRFRAVFGLGPETVARVIRLQHAASMAGRLPWPDIAHHCGYADQAHFNRDFRALTGCAPTDFAPVRASARSSEQ